MANKIPRVPVREQDPKVRATNFEEVCYGYNIEEAVLEASRCLNCKQPRCVTACPVNIRIPDFIHQLLLGNFTESARIISEDSSLPSICGRVCPQENQCEGSCILGIKGEPVAIGKLERFIGDWQIEHEDQMPAPEIKRNGHKVAVIGSGPSSLACASDLARMGYTVKIFEALHKVGGVLVYGIPEFRLPKERIVAKEVEAVKKLGVEIETDVIVGRTVTIDSLMHEEGYEAVFIGSGAGLPRFMGIPGENLNGVVSANEFLTRTNLMKAYDSHYDTPIYVGKTFYGKTQMFHAIAESVSHFPRDGMSFYIRRNSALRQNVRNYGFRQQRSQYVRKIFITHFSEIARKSFVKRFGRKRRLEVYIKRTPADIVTVNKTAERKNNRSAYSAIGKKHFPELGVFFSACFYRCPNVFQRQSL